MLTEPLSKIEKVVEQIRYCQPSIVLACSHPDYKFDLQTWDGCRTSLVVGAYPLGILGTALLRLAGFGAYVVEIVPEGSAMVELYCTAGNLAMIFEYSGIATTAVELISHMSRSSDYLMTDITNEGVTMRVDAGQLARQIVCFNQVVADSVNSNCSHFEMALCDMLNLNSKFNHLLEETFPHRFCLEDYDKAFNLNNPGHIKTAIEV
ncbi:MAG: hypothetical protein QGH66_05380 [Dehalococcoidia bacterium]|nr:hypothetical protein [Dehalococcoidia bacterium]MDP7240221.1 hypothetical protein [Dehalococcoidia bacterium]